MRFILLFLLFYSSLFSREISYFEDKQNSLTPKEIVTNTKFLPLNQNDLNIGITNSTYWLKLHIDNNNSTEIKKIISFKSPLMDRVSLYKLQNNELMRLDTVGHLVKQNKDRAIEPNLSLHITLLAHSQNVFYIKIKSQAPINLSFSIYSPKEFADYSLIWYSSMALYTGAVVMILIYNLVLYFFIRIRSYLYYVIFHTLFLFFILDVNGYLVQFIYPNNPIWERLTVPLLLSLTLLAQIVFAYEFLDVKNNGKKSKKVFKIFMAILFIIIPLNFIVPFKESIQVINLMAIFVNLIPLIIAIIYWVKLNEKYAKYYTIAWSIFILGNILENLKIQGLIELDFFTLNPMQIGALVEMIVISVALADRFNTIRNKNRELTFMIHTDFLTKIKNRNYFFEHTNRLLAILKRREEDHTLIMLDIDYFKAINDTHGHAIGDKVLVEFSQKITELLREEDLFARIGGEEFILLIRANEKDALILATRILEMVESLTISTNKDMIKFTVSSGLHAFNSAKLSVDELLCKADDALYKAKEKGRNRVEISS